MAAGKTRAGAPARLASLVVAAALAGCAVGPDFKAPAGPADDAYTEQPVPTSTVSAPGLGGAAQTFSPGRDIPAQWWTIFHSPDVDSLVRDALANSPTLGAAQATLRQARETLRASEGALLLPSVTGQLQAARQHTPSGAAGALSSSSISSGAFGAPGGATPQAFQTNTVAATVNVAYNLDVFGGARRQIEGFQAQVDFQKEALQAAYLTLTANVVTTALREASIRAQLKATQEVADAQAKQLEVVRRQYELGAVPKATLLQQRTQLAATNASIPGLDKQLAQTRDQLAVLIGKTPSTARLPTVTLESLSLPTRLPVSLPSDLVRQRPDVRASEAQLHQTSAQIGVATANMLPQFNITAAYGGVNSTLADLLSPASTIWSLAAGVTQPIFRGGQLAAERRAAVAAYDTPWQQHRGTVLQAVQNVADTLVALDSDA